MRRPNECMNCKNEFLGHSIYQLYCPDCYQKLKGGKRKMAKKKETEETEESEDSEEEEEESSVTEKTKKTPKTAERVMLAEKTLNFIINTLKVPENEVSKILSRCFTILKQK